ncbi:Bax inhibitor-1 family protein [Luteolibacter flavescens]|uniref:Bax inhibitor-1 family protein n=1 Tax=Luteolibacter flavescens TaxID=1859460 RepID=A0ABT3FV91_9BACT|nr:Bax inhibitor-1 family protein [Luteolibacter flavescens]MCW1887499.1 Bax inhibitor-1 family protein [Luteolibacter flavescens]
MNSSFNPYAVGPVAEAPLETRTDFVRKTYYHLAGAILAFAALEAVLLAIVPPEAVFGWLSSGKFNMLLVLGAFMGASYIANKWAYSSTSKSTQYLGLGLYVVAQAAIFLPMLLFAKLYDPMAIGKAGVVTGGLVLGLTAIAFTTKKDFTFLGGALKIGGIVAIGLVVSAILFGFGLGTWFSVGMIVLAAGSILYTTSAMLYHYSPGQHVAASLSLFASVATMFYYVLRLFMSRD